MAIANDAATKSAPGIDSGTIVKKEPRTTTPAKYMQAKTQQNARANLAQNTVSPKVVETGL